uniref:Uncharacterized protein n=1 Tax=Nelumbo nucifera TaxID=4432 RepID=A0A822ZVM8_NELNU|nr:TPA_asm: hypothetical protein HUJ06_016873 [Nelumbo nucifera]
MGRHRRKDDGNCMWKERIREWDALSELFAAYERRSNDTVASLVGHCLWKEIREWDTSPIVGHHMWKEIKEWDTSLERLYHSPPHRLPVIACGWRSDDTIASLLVYCRLPI